MTAPKPLKINDGAQANASLLLKQTTTTKVNKKKEEREDATRPGTVASPLEEASSEVPSETPSTLPQSPEPPEGPFSDSPLERALQNWGENLKRKGGSAR
jgi:hypothetical protein